MDENPFNHLYLHLKHSIRETRTGRVGRGEITPDHIEKLNNGLVENRNRELGTKNRYLG